MALVTKLEDLCPVRCFNVETGEVLVTPSAPGPPVLPGLLEKALPCGTVGLFVWPPQPGGAGYCLEVLVFRREDLMVLPELDALRMDAEPRLLVAHEGLAMLLTASAYPGPILMPDFSLVGAEFDPADQTFLGTTRFIWFSPGQHPVDAALFLPLAGVHHILANRLPGCFLKRERAVGQREPKADVAPLPPLAPPPHSVPGAELPRRGGILNLTNRTIRFVTPDPARRQLGDLPPFDEGSVPMLHHQGELTGFLNYHGQYVPTFVRSTTWASARLVALLQLQGPDTPGILVPDDIASYLIPTYQGQIYSLGPDWAMRHPERPSLVEVTCLFRWK